MTKRSAGFACDYGNGTHGYAVRTSPDRDNMMCEPCANAYDALIDAQDAWQNQMTSDASNLLSIVQPACSDCMLAHSIIEVNEAADNSYDGSDEVSNAYDHLATHVQVS